MSLLPTKATKPKTNFEEYTTLIYGAPKTGKSTLASQFEKPLFLATEAGLNALETYSIEIDTWEKFCVACAEITAGGHGFKTIVIDTVDNLFNMCSSYVCKRNNIQHESDLSYGKGWKLVKDEFMRAIIKLSLLPYGLVMISHAELVEIKTRTSTLSKWVPTMSKQAREKILPMCDFIFFVVIEGTDEGEQRFIRTKACENWEAGDRTGRLPERIELNYKAIKEEFKKAVGGK